MSYKFDFEFLAERWPDFVAGAWLTIQLTVASIALGFLVGTVCALARVYGGPVLRRIVGIYVEAIRNTPLLIQIFIVYFGLSSLGFDFFPNLWKIGFLVNFQSLAVMSVHLYCRTVCFFLPFLFSLLALLDV